MTRGSSLHPKTVPANAFMSFIMGKSQLRITAVFSNTFNGRSSPCDVGLSSCCARTPPPYPPCGSLAPPCPPCGSPSPPYPPWGSPSPPCPPEGSLSVESRPGQVSWSHFGWAHSSSWPVRHQDGSSQDGPAVGPCLHAPLEVVC